MASGRTAPEHLTALLGEWRRPGTPVYVALADRLRLLVEDGRLPAGTALPSQRLLCARLGLSRTTVTAAIEILRADDVLVSRAGAASVVRMPGGPSSAPMLPFADVIDVSRATARAVPGVQPAVRAAVERLGTHLDRDGYELLGLRELRAALAERMSRDGLPTESDELLVTAGASGAISFLAAELVTRGDVVAVEAPGYPHTVARLRRQGARLIPIRVDEAGWDLAAFAAAARRSPPLVIVTMPDFHNPTGASMSDDERRHLLHVARRAGALVVVDATTADLDLDGRAARTPLAAIDPRVITVGSASKTIWGGLRVGWIRADAARIRSLANARLSFDLGSPVLDQLVVHEMMPRLDDAIRHRIDEQRITRDRLAAALADLFPTWRMPDARGGLSAWIELEGPMSSALASAARRQGLVIGAGPWFGLAGEFDGFIRFPLTVDPDLVGPAMRLLRAARDRIGG